MYVYHEPVMGPEVLDYLTPNDEGFYLDGTVGGGGHTRLILDACAGCRVLAVDRDPEALDEARASLEDVLLHMADNNVECVLVTKDGRLAGIFTVVDACRAFSKELRSQRPDGHDAA